jgi:uncharacterized protein involved in outer membrane biogenesis
VQTTLLGLAIAIILALLTAIVAPLVIDWNHYRGPIEAEASRLAGLDVHVRGSIDARLVPTPMITLRDVDAGGAGAAGGKPLLHATELKLELALGPLLRGQLQATEVDLVAPQVDVTLDHSGALALPSAAPPFHPEATSIAQLAIKDGRIAMTDAASGARLVLQKVWFTGDFGSLAGPFQGQGAAVVGDELYGYRLSGNPAGGGATQIRLAVDPSNQPLTTEFDGKLTFAHGVPQFDGAMALARPVGATLGNGKRVISAPWRATAALHATPAAATLRNVALRYGPEERSLNFTGSADLTFGAHPALAGKIAAMQLDVDRALASPDFTDRPPLLVLRSFLPAFMAAAQLPMPAKIDVSIDTLTIGGTSLEALSGNLAYDRAGWTLNDFHFHAPGMTDVGLSGRLTGTAQSFAFSGPAKLASADFEMLLAWLDGRGGDRASAEAETLNAQGDLTVASDRMAVERLAAALGSDKIEGRLAYTWPADRRPAQLDADLRAAALDVDAVSAFVKSALGGGSLAPPQKASLALDIGEARFAGMGLQGIGAKVKYDSGQLQIDRLSIGNVGGAKVDISGRIDELSSQPRGQMTLDVDAGALDGLSALAAKFDPRAAVSLQRLAGRLAPAKVHAVLDVERAAAAGSTADFHLSGSLAALRVAIDAKASGQPAHLGDAAVQITSRIDADDGSMLIALLGLDRVIGVDQLPGRLTLAAAGPLDGDMHVDGKIEASGLDTAVAGTARLLGDGPPSGKLTLQATIADLRPLQQLMTGQTGAAVPASARAAVAIDGAKFSFNDIAATIGKASVNGDVALTWANPVLIDGAVSADTIDAASVTGLLLGLPSTTPNAGATWSSTTIGAGAFAPLHGAVTFKLKHADFTPALSAGNLSGTVNFDPSAIGLKNIDGSFAGGRISGSLAFRRTADGLGVHAKLGLADVAAAALAGQNLGAGGGQLTAAIQCDGFGASPAALIGSLHGGASVALKDVQFAGLNVAAFAAARRAAGPIGPIDAGKIQAAVNAALSSGHLVVPNGDIALPIASGMMNLNRVTLQAEGGAALSLNGAIDLDDAAIDAHMTLSEASPPSALIAIRPEFSVDIKGPLSAPRRSLDVAALTGWLTLSTAELQTRRIESIEANQHEAPRALAGHVSSPDVEAPSPGTVVESAMSPSLLSAPGAGRSLERLHLPPAPPATPPQSSSGAGTGPAAPTAPAAAPLVLRPSKPAAPRDHNGAAAAGGSQQSNRQAAPQARGPNIHSD